DGLHALPVLERVIGRRGDGGSGRALGAEQREVFAPTHDGARLVPGEVGRDGEQPGARVVGLLVEGADERLLREVLRALRAPDLAMGEPDQVAVGRAVHLGPVEARGHTVRPARGTPPTRGCWSRCVVHASAGAARRPGTRPGTGAAEPVGAVLHPPWPIRTPRARRVP